ILTYSKPGVSEGNSKEVFRIMSYNIGYLSGMSNSLPLREDKDFFDNNKKEFIRLLNSVQPDFVGYQEMDFHSHRSHYADQLRDVVSGFGFAYAAKAINWDKRYVPFPNWPPAAHFKRMVSGQALTSNFPIISNRRIVLEKIKNKPFYYRAFYLDRLAQVVELEVGKRQLVIINIHLEAFEKETRKRQAQEVLEIYRSLKDQYPVLLIGDFNCVPPFATRKHGFLDEPDLDFFSHNVVTLFLKEESLREAILHGQKKISERESFTFPSDQPSRKLDYIFYNHHDIKCLNAYVLDIDSSDHRPMIMEFSFKDQVK
ncbi:MAG: endonuclease/exonuclease/phosphatase family protein, partial [Candidatus Aminicenantes bacterium]|nr:endonuclease/exonuclease/phosphatase family protein [Candidatus Aminicenantes bacterium]